jgi:hypothetical protein
MMVPMLRNPSAAASTIVCSIWFTVLSGLGCGSSVAGLGGAPNSAGTIGGAGSGAGTNGAGTSAGQAGMRSDAGSLGSSAGSSGNAAAGASGGSGCDRPGLVWKTANKTNYTSYPEPGSEECVKFSGCLYEGLFAACPEKRSLEWVKSHNIVAAFPDLKTLALHDLCLKSGQKTIVVTVYDTCGDSDCDNCCTQNKGDKQQLIDIESFTDARWGVPDGAIEWADLGPTKGSGCD